MPKFQKKPVIIEAIQWFKLGDHTRVQPFLKNGKILVSQCVHCGLPYSQHGWVDTLEGGHIVCPGDWIIEGISGEFYPCKPDIFEATYARVDDHMTLTKDEQ